ncbi:MAG: arginine deiminase-related protein [Dyella sp.]
MTNARFLMCSPAYFEVAYVINPWMQGNVDHARHAVATAQWHALYDLLSARATVDVLEGAPGLPDMPFAANAGLVLGERFIPSRFRHAERRGEEAPFSEWFQTAGFSLLHSPADQWFEGAGDALLDRAQARLWMGHGHRSDLACADWLRQALDIEVLPLRLIDARFYHLDTCFCPLKGGYLMYYPPAFDAPSLALIERHVAPQQRVVIDEADALDFACNAVDVGDAVLLNRASTSLAARLKAIGVDTLATPLGEFMKAGGAAKCLTLRLDEPVLRQSATSNSPTPALAR